MESLYESMVMYYLTHLGNVFICPQFPLEGSAGSVKYPDFVALDFSGRDGKAQIVEVSVAFNTKDLQEKVKWYVTEGASRLGRKLVDLGISDRLLKIEVLVFGRAEARTGFEKLANDAVAVRFEPIEVAFERWRWDWSFGKVEK